LNITNKMDSLRVKTIADSDESAIRTLDAARELAPKIRATADEIEQGRRLPPHLVGEMQRAGVFRMAMPWAWGGPVPVAAIMDFGHTSPQMVMPIGCRAAIDPRTKHVSIMEAGVT
jgi:alkylation response protein AidB-like acyl-CoA dehydrogenase